MVHGGYACEEEKEEAKLRQFQGDQDERECWNSGSCVESC